MKYRVGDIVKVKSASELLEQRVDGRHIRGLLFPLAMIDTAGTTFRVDVADSDSTVTGDGVRYWYHEDMVELVYRDEKREELLAEIKSTLEAFDTAVAKLDKLKGMI